MKLINFIAIYSILIISVIFSFEANAATIAGILKNEKREPIANQKIFLNDEKFSMTDNSGNFFFRDVDRGNYYLTTNIDDEKIILKQVAVTNLSEEISLGDVYFVKKIYPLKEIQISEIYTTRHFDRLTEIKENVIYSGKKMKCCYLTILMEIKRKMIPDKF